ncbi:hypothetical protein BO71DRAFT_437991 [Aspergillus ellipticus CBS 707.79]|uniref:Uncharacterized protein n=1 Tax=Aspergillus ellipticus CBS 707.79 TaxID=1448320 RepID=A0A319DMC3_9EURO|nr:hypothetical protein BO71DRAFT_437991 [Aspergillus ellipticus CBS 707.79]
MFRRKRSSSQHQVPLSHSSSQSAQYAASHAFLKSQHSSSSLSSAAAAAALRSLTPTPTSVENVQTRRMMQRRASVSSQASGAPSLRPTSRNGLRRSSSSASMGTRTFRDQSPRRPASSSGPSARPTTQTAPPLPSIPSAYTARNSQQITRSSSLGPSMRPTPRAKPRTERGSSVDREIRNPGPASTPSPDLRRPASRNSVNFSYPMTSRPTSPSGPVSPSDRRDVSAGVSLAGHLSSPDSPKTKNVSPRAAKLAKNQGVSPGSPARGVPSAGTAVAAAQAAIVPRSPDANPPPSAAPRMSFQLPRELTVPGSVPSQPAPTEHRQTTRPILAKRPSTVTEDAQGEKRAESGPAQPPAQPPAQSTTVPRVGAVTPDVQPVVKLPPTPDTVKDQLLSPPVSPPESTRSSDIGPDGQSSNMRQSGSPARSARFSRHLLVAAFAGEQLHQPPPRSLSPAKSAMKNTRKSSLSPEGRTESVLRPGPALSELSDATSVGSDDGLKQGARRKPIKVSFDDEAEVMGTAASPPTSPEALPESPPEKPKSKTNWFSAKRKPSPLNTKVDEFDEVLKPRRALPSFGSIRAGRDGDVQDKAQPEQSDNESTTSSDSPAEVLGWSFSNDHAIGGIIANTQPAEGQSRVAPMMLANAAESESEAEKSPQQDHFPAEPAPQAVPDESSGAPDVPPDTPPVRTSATLAVPDITVQPASPDIEKSRNSLEWYEVPGGYPRTSLESDRKVVNKSKKEKPARNSTDEIPVDIAEDGESGDESGESIYSDAEEDFEGNGFGSINAIVDADSEGTPTPPADCGNNEKAPPQDWPDFPETCHIAGKANAVPSHVMTPIPESPGSSHELLPFSSPYPPFPTKPKVKSASQGNLSRSSSVTVKPARHSMAVGANDGKMADQTPHSSVNGTASIQPGPPQARQRSPQDKVRARPASWSPVRGNGPQVNGKISPASARPLSSGSDSSSSFKRATRPRTESTHSMRRTMRGCPPGRLAARATSPQAEARPMSSDSGGGNMGTLRTTLRGNTPKREKREKPSFFSTGKAPKSKLTKTPAGTFVSRFPDSDDDDEGYEAWKSRHRYEDSSDEGEQDPNLLRPVRGIPRRQGARDGDSTELEDSSDEDHRARHTPRAMTQSPTKPNASRDPALAVIAKNRGMSDEELDDFLRQPNRGRKPGLFQRFSIRKSKSPVDRRLTKTGLGGSLRKAAPPDRPRLDHDSARGDSALPGTESNVVTTITATNPPPQAPSKLLRRPSQRSTRVDSWPLRSDSKEPGEVPVPAGKLSERLARVDEAGQNGSAVVAPAAESATKENENPQTAASGVKSEPAIASDVVITPSGRKKRFPRLRKAFGLRS